MQVFVIESCERGIDEGFHVSAVRSTMEKAEAYVRSCGKMRDWRVRPGQNENEAPSAFAIVWVGSRRRGSEYCFSIRAYTLE
jgi:hypothetical protein